MLDPCGVRVEVVVPGPFASDALNGGPNGIWLSDVFPVLPFEWMAVVPSTGPRRDC